MTARATTRRSPKGGYANPAKEAWRSWVWAFLRGGANHRPGKTAQAMLMPSLEGLEIDSALSSGFQESNLHIVDSNPAIVATLKRRRPSVNTYGVSFVRAHERMWVNGTSLRAASIDVCCQVTSGLLRALAQCSAFDVWDDGARIIVNVLRGREQPDVRAAMLDHPYLRRARWVRRLTRAQHSTTEYPLNAGDAWRCWLIASSLEGHLVIPRSVRSYLSNNGQSFLSLAFCVYRPTTVVDHMRMWDRDGQHRGPLYDALESDVELQLCAEMFRDARSDEGASWWNASLIRSAVARNNVRARNSAVGRRWDMTEACELGQRRPTATVTRTPRPSAAMSDLGRMLRCIENQKDITDSIEALSA